MKVSAASKRRYNRARLARRGSGFLAVVRTLRQSTRMLNDMDLRYLKMWADMERIIYRGPVRYGSIGNCFA